MIPESGYLPVFSKTRLKLFNFEVLLSFFERNQLHGIVSTFFFFFFFFFLPVFIKQRVMFLVIRVRKGPEVVKNWYGVKIAVETWTFADLFDRFSSGAVDKTAPLKDMGKYTLNINIGQKKTELTQLSPDVLTGEAVQCLGNFVHFSLLEKENETEITDTNTQACAFKILTSSANLSNHLSQKKTSMNSKAKLFNDIISWLEAQEVGFLSTNVDKLGSQLVNVLANIMWYIRGKI